MKLDDKEARNRLAEFGAAIEALSLYDYNTFPDDIIEDVFGKAVPAGRHHARYLKEKQDLLVERGILNLWGKLSGDYRRKFVRALYDRYGEEAVARSDTVPGGEFNQIEAEPKE